MESPRVHPVLRDLLATAVSEMEDTAIQCSEIAEQLENGELLAALGGLSGCENTIRTTTVVIRAVHDWQQRSNQNPTTQLPDA